MAPGCRDTPPGNWLIGAALILCYTCCCGAADAEVCPAAPVLSQETRLLKCLLEDSGLNPLARPVLNSSQPLNVLIQPYILKVVDMEEKNHVMVTNGWLYHEWQDFQLTWKPSDFGDIKRISIPINLIWKPDIILFNNADERYAYVYDDLAVVLHTGQVTWVPHARLRSYCDLDLTRFPFDQQTCQLVFGSWTYHDKAVNATLKNNGSFNYMAATPEWRLDKQEAKNFSWKYNSDEYYSGVIISLTLTRDSSFYQYTFILPTVLLAYLALLIPAIAPLSRERVTFCAVLLLIGTLILSMLDGHMPTEMGTVPVVAAYLAYVMVMVCISLFFSLLCISMYLRDPRQGKVPGWMRWIFLTKLNKLVCLPVESYTAIPGDLAVEENVAERELYEYSNGNMTSPPHSEQTALSGALALEQTMHEIRRYLRLLAARASVRMPAANHKELVTQEWIQVARVIDRIMFIVFFVLTVVITISMYAHY